MCAYSYSYKANAYIWFLYERQQMTSSSNRYIQMTTFVNAYEVGGEDTIVTTFDYMNQNTFLFMLMILLIRVLNTFIMMKWIANETWTMVVYER
jgi:hypothetical protein